MFARFSPSLLTLLTMVSLCAAQVPPPDIKVEANTESGVKAPAAKKKGADTGENKTDTSSEDRDTLTRAGLPSDGLGLIDYFRKRINPKADPARVKELIRELGHEDFQVREKAQHELQILGTAAFSELKKAASDPDAERRERAGELCRQIEAKSEAGLQEAAARTLARLQPQGAADVLLAYLPFAADLTVIDEICRSLVTLSIRGGEVDPAMIRAVNDKEPLRRAAAGQVLSHVANQQTAVRKLLKDPEPLVRLRVALALVERRQKDAIPIMIDALGHLPPEQLIQAEEFLLSLAGENAPQVSLGNTDATRNACRDAWARWWQENQGKIDLAKASLTRPTLGYTLIVQHKFIGRGVGEVMELDKERKVRWSFEVPNYPVDAHFTGANSVLVAEFQGMQVTERDLKGNIKRQIQVPGNPIGAQKLSNGNMFVVLQNRLIEYNPQGKEVFSFAGGQFFRARKLPNGEIIYVTNRGTLVRMESRTRRRLKSFSVGNLATPFGSIDILPNGHVLVPQFHNAQVAEFDREGRQVKALPCMAAPTAVSRLPNGHTLVGSTNSQMVAEFDRSGRQLWAFQSGGMVFNVRGR
jgi:HEAT repeat protein